MLNELCPNWSPRMDQLTPTVGQVEPNNLFFLETLLKLLQRIYITFPLTDRQ